MVFFFAIVLAGCLPPALLASPITLAPTTSGELTEHEECGQPGCFVLHYHYQNPLQQLNYRFTLEPGVATYDRTLAYLVFDLGGIAFDVQSAFLALDLQYAQAANPALTVSALDASFTPQLTAVPSGSTYISIFDMSPSGIAAYLASRDLFQAIDGGNALGTLGASGPLGDVVNIALNSAAIDQINSAGGLWSVGLRWTPHPEGSFFNQSDAILFNAAPRLVLSAQSSVPTPGTMALFAIALVTLGLPLSPRKQ